MLASSYGEIEEKIKKVVDDLSIQSKANIATTARKFDVPCQRLEHRYKGIPSKIESGGQNKKTFQNSKIRDLSISGLSEFERT